MSLRKCLVLVALLGALIASQIALGDYRTRPLDLGLISHTAVFEVGKNGDQRLVRLGVQSHPDYTAAVAPGAGAKIGLDTYLPGNAERTYKQTAYNFLNRPLYSMYNKLSWKWDAKGACTVVSRSGWGVIESAGEPRYTYTGLVSSSVTGSGSTMLTSRYKGCFHYCEDYPTRQSFDIYSPLEVKGYAGGSSGSSKY